MAWGLPPSYKESTSFANVSHDKMIEAMLEIVEQENYKVKQHSPYTLVATKKLPFTVYSFLIFTRPLLHLSVRADEDGILTLEMEFHHSSRYASSFNDLGKCKNHLKDLLSRVKRIL